MDRTEDLNAWMRPVDLARPHHLSAQAIRNYEAEAILPPAHRTPSAQRRYHDTHRLALDAFVYLTKAAGRQAAAQIVAAVTAGDLPTALEKLDELHAQLSQDRRTIRQVENAIRDLPDPCEQTTSPLTPVELARRLKITTTTLRHWEQASILHPPRQGSHRRYHPHDVRDADLAHLMRRAGTPLPAIAATIHELRTHHTSAHLPETLASWQTAINTRADNLLTATAALHAYRQVQT